MCRKSWTILWCAGVLSLVAVSSSTAFQPPAPETALMSGPIELSRVVDVAAQKLGVRITYDESLLKSKVTLRLSRSISDVELWALANRLLAEQGLTTARLGSDSTLSVVKLATAVQMLVPEEATGGDGGGLAAEAFPAGCAKVLVRLQHLTPKEAAPSVQSVLSKPGGVVTEDAASGTLVIADYRAQVGAALKLLTLIDVPGPGAPITPYLTNHLAPEALVTLANQVVAKRALVAPGGRSAGEVLAAPDGKTVLIVAPAGEVARWADLLAQLDQRESVETRTYVPHGFGLDQVATLIENTVHQGNGAGGQGSGADDRWRVVLDELTGTLIVTATPSQHEQVQATLDRLESIPTGTRWPVKTFTVKNRSVREVSEILERMIEAGALATTGESGDANDSTAAGDALLGGGERAGAPANSPTRPKTPGNTSTGIQSTPPPGKSPTYPGTSGPNRVQDGGRSALSRPTESHVAGDGLTLTLDEGTNTIIAVGEPRLLAQIERLLPTLDVRQPQVMIEALLVSLNDSQSLELGVELEKIEINGDTLFRIASLFGLSMAGAGGTGGRTVGDAAGFTGVAINPGDFSVIIRALETLNNGRAVTMPKVLVNNNQQATFNSTLQQPFATTNASSTVATTSFGGTFDAGTTISVRPQIAAGDHLLLQYDVRLSSFTGAGSATLPPPRQENSVSSAATIPDGYTVAVGGLETTTEGDGEKRIPGIGAIPVIGELFKSRTKQQSRTRFFVFLRANVMRHESFEDLKHLSTLEANAASVDDGWPVVEPRVIR